MVQMKNRVSGLLMERGVSYNKQRLHKVGYFGELMTTNKEVQQSIRPVVKLSRDMIRGFIAKFRIRTDRVKSPCRSQ